MIHSILAFLLCLGLASSALAQEKPGALPSNQQRSAGFILPADVNVRVESDPRTLIVMAAINVAGFDAETGGLPLSPLRAELRKDLVNIDPQLRARLSAFYKAHRRPGVDEMTDATRYAALSLLMTLKLVFAVCLVLAHQRFLQNKGLVLIIITSFVALPVSLNLLKSAMRAAPSG